MSITQKNINCMMNPLFYRVIAKVANFYEIQKVGKNKYSNIPN